MAGVCLPSIPAVSWAQQEPITLVCSEVKTEPAATERFFIHLDFDRKAVRFHRRDLPVAKILMVQNWRVEFADDERSPTLLGSINRITGDLSVERATRSGDKNSVEVLRATCERASPVF